MHAGRCVLVECVIFLAKGSYQLLTMNSCSIVTAICGDVCKRAISERHVNVNNT